MTKEQDKRLEEIRENNLEKFIKFAESVYELHNRGATTSNWIEEDNEAFLLSEIDRLKESDEVWRDAKDISDKISEDRIIELRGLQSKIDGLEAENKDLKEENSKERQAYVGIELGFKEQTKKLKKLEAENKELIRKALERDRYYEKAVNAEDRFVLASKLLDEERSKVNELEAENKELKEKLSQLDFFDISKSLQAKLEAAEEGLESLRGKEIYCLRIEIDGTIVDAINEAIDKLLEKLRSKGND